MIFSFSEIKLLQCEYLQTAYIMYTVFFILLICDLRFKVSNLNTILPTQRMKLINNVDWMLLCSPCLLTTQFLGIDKLIEDRPDNDSLKIFYCFNILFK